MSAPGRVEFAPPGVPPQDRPSPQQAADRLGVRVVEYAIHSSCGECQAMTVDFTRETAIQWALEHEQAHHDGRRCTAAVENFVLKCYLRDPRLGS